MFLGMWLFVSKEKTSLFQKRLKAERQNKTCNIKSGAFGDYSIVLMTVRLWLWD